MTKNVRLCIIKKNKQTRTNMREKEKRTKMNKILILADDLTGANDTGAAIGRFGWNTVSIVNAGQRPLNLEDYSCISVNLDSRSLKPEEAYEMTADTARDLRTLKIGLYSKRIDSTLRGNLGAESDALLDVLTEEEKKDWAALIVPAFPHKSLH